ncbi:hypothetical protein BpJC4_29810 [Weizmannia acidilactici]|nr:hypothetical protein BpJC4_29810 [Weizmannia acidilactici]
MMAFMHNFPAHRSGLVKAVENNRRRIRLTMAIMITVELKIGSPLFFWLQPFYEEVVQKRT